MRRTLTIDDDLDKLIRREMAASKDGFREVINKLLRLGLQARQVAKTSPPLSIQPVKMGSKPGVSFESIADLEERLEE